MDFVDFRLGLQSARYNCELIGTPIIGLNIGGEPPVFVVIFSAPFYLGNYSTVSLDSRYVAPGGNGLTTLTLLN